jgi:hypothetical protein
MPMKLLPQLLGCFLDAGQFFGVIEDTFVRNLTINVWLDSPHIGEG